MLFLFTTRVSGSYSGSQPFMLCGSFSTLQLGSALPASVLGQLLAITPAITSHPFHDLWAASFQPLLCFISCAFSLTTFSETSRVLLCFSVDIPWNIQAPSTRRRLMGETWPSTMTSKTCSSSYKIWQWKRGSSDFRCQPSFNCSCDSTFLLLVLLWCLGFIYSNI